MFEDGRYLRAITARDTPAARQQLWAIGQLLLLARAFDARQESVETTGESGIERKRQFLGFVRRLWTAADKRVAIPPSAEDAVYVGTVHSAKGLEFPAVFVPFLAEGRFPFNPPYDHAPPPPGLVADPDPNTDEAELHSLFFVALTRAKDVLYVSRAESYGGKPSKPSRLLDLLAVAREAGWFAEERWTEGAGALSDAMADQPGERPEELSYAAFKDYHECPRKYFYAHILGLPEPTDGRAYLMYRKATNAVLRWLEERHRAGTYPRDWNEVESTFGTVWAEQGPIEHPHNGFYRAEALRTVQQKWEHGQSIAPAPAWRRQATGTIDGVRFTVPVEATRDEGGTLRVGHRYHRPRKSKDDHLEHRFALMRRALAGEGRTVLVEAHYPDEVVEIKPLRRDAEERRIEDFRTAVRGIEAGHFPPTPRDAERECPRCPFNLVCPA